MGMPERVNKTDWLILKPHAPFGMKIWWLLEKNRMSQTELAKKCDTGIPTVWRWLQSDSWMTCRHVLKLAEIFKVSPEWLMDDPPNVRRDQFYVKGYVGLGKKRKLKRDDSDNGWYSF